MGYEDINYLDDLGAAELEESAEEAFDCLGWILSTIGIDKSISKACPPAYVMVFLGILVDALRMMLEITPERRQEIIALLDEWSDKKTTTLRDIQVLVGKLSFVCSTV